MKYFRLLLLPIFLLTFSCENRETIKENEQLKTQVNELKSMMSRMRQSDDKLMLLASKLSGVKARIKTNYGNIELKFFPETAPIQCFNFISRAESGYYDGTQFHRVIKGFMIQGGDPNSKTADKESYGKGGPLVMVPHEFSEISHKRGILSTARNPNINLGAGSQFFIIHQDYPSLDKKYTVFGEVTKGMDVVDKIATTKTNERDYPLNPVNVSTIEIYR